MSGLVLTPSFKEGCRNVRKGIQSEKIKSEKKRHKAKVLL
jgi:hypothetical protein